MSNKVYVIVEFDCWDYFQEVVLVTADKGYAESLVEASLKKYEESCGRCNRYSLIEKDSVSMTSNIDTVRDKRLMVFTSLLRTLNFVGHARVDQCYGLFVEFEEQYPLIDGYTRTGKAVDHTNMKMFIKLYKEI